MGCGCLVVMLLSGFCATDAKTPDPVVIESGARRCKVLSLGGVDKAQSVADGYLNSNVKKGQPKKDIVFVKMDPDFVFEFAVWRELVAADVDSAVVFSGDGADVAYVTAAQALEKYGEVPVWEPNATRDPLVFVFSARVMSVSKAKDAAAKLLVDKDYEAAQSVLAKALTAAPSDALAWALMGCACLRQKHYPEAIQALEKSLALRIDEAYLAELYLGLAYWKTGAPGKASECLKKAAAPSAGREHPQFTYVEVVSEVTEAMKVQSEPIKKD